MRVAFYTLGCKLNQCESEALASSFGSQGFFIVSPAEPADIYVVNTCTVTSKSEQKARRMIRRFSREHPESAVIVTGCYAQMEPEIFESLGPRISVVSGEQKSRLLELPVYLNESGCGASLVEEGVRQVLSGESGTGEDPFRFNARTFTDHSRPFLKIQDGCNNRCTYCRVTLARGDSVSLDPEEIIRRTVALEADGFDEIVLTGINLSLYSAGEKTLNSLLDSLLSATSRTRFRLSSIEPDWLVAEHLDVLAHDRICPHFHLPIQSGDDGILKAMARRYRSDRVLEGVRQLREIKDDPFIAADIIAGFPGEDDSAYRNTLALLEEIEPAALHVFPYSSRPETAAALFPHPVPERITGLRTAELRLLSSEWHSAYARRWNTGLQRVLVETAPGKDGAGRGLTGNYLHVEIPPVDSLLLQKGKAYAAQLKQEDGRLLAIISPYSGE